MVMVMSPVGMQEASCTSARHSGWTNRLHRVLHVMNQDLHPPLPMEEPVEVGSLLRSPLEVAREMRLDWFLHNCSRILKPGRGRQRELICSWRAQKCLLPLGHLQSSLWLKCILSHLRWMWHRHLISQVHPFLDQFSKHWAMWAKRSGV